MNRDVEDKMDWMDAKKYIFLVKSFYNFLGQERVEEFLMRVIWNATASTKLG